MGPNSKWRELVLYLHYHGPTEGENWTGSSLLGYGDVVFSNHSIFIGNLVTGSLGQSIRMRKIYRGSKNSDTRGTEFQFQKRGGAQKIKTQFFGPKRFQKVHCCCCLTDSQHSETFWTFRTFRMGGASVNNLNIASFWINKLGVAGFFVQRKPSILKITNLNV